MAVYLEGYGMFYILMGEDSYSLNKALNKIRDEFAEESFSGNVTFLDGENIALNDLQVACETSPFLSNRRLVIVHSLLKRFETKAKADSVGTKKTMRGVKDNQDWQGYAGCINSLPDFTTLVLVEESISNSNQLFSEISDKAIIQKFPLLKYKELSVWIRNFVESLGSTISNTAVDLLIKFIGNDLWAMSNEIQKLILYTEGRVINENDVKTIVTQAQEASIFVLVDAVLEGRTGLAQNVASRLINQGLSIPYILSMISRQTRLSLLAREMLSLHISKDEMRSKLGLAPFAFEKTLEHAGKHSYEQMVKIYEKILETDISIKTGIYRDELALNLMLAELSLS